MRGGFLPEIKNATGLKDFLTVSVLTIITESPKSINLCMALMYMNEGWNVSLNFQAMF